jgi:hypothetical protein
MDAATFREHAKVFASLTDDLASQPSSKKLELSLSDVEVRDGRVYSFVVHYSRNAFPDERTLVAKLIETYGPASDTSQHTETDGFDHGLTMTTHHLWRSDAASIILDIRKTISDSVERSQEYTLRFADLDVEADLSTAADGTGKGQLRAREGSVAP